MLIEIEMECRWEADAHGAIHCPRCQHRPKTLPVRRRCPAQRPPTSRARPGSELAQLLKRLQVASDCQLCSVHASLMDQWGCEECRRRLPEIAGWLRKSFGRLPWSAKLRAMRRLRQFVHWRRPFESLAQLAIELAELSAFRQCEIADLSRVTCPVAVAGDDLQSALAAAPPGTAIRWDGNTRPIDAPPICELPLEPIRVAGTPTLIALPGGAYVDVRPKPLPPPGKLIRLDQQGGFGDAVELTAVLRHLRHYYPRARLEVITEPDRAALYTTSVPDPTIGRPLVDAVIFRADADYSTHPLNPWPGHSRSFATCPSSPVEHCLVDRLGLEPIAELCHYWVPRPEVRGQRSEVGGQIALCHFAGDHRKAQKNLTLVQRSEVICQLHSAGYQVSVLGEDVTASNAAALIELIGGCELFVGVDSGPLHLASALGKRAIGLWTYLSPLHSFCHDRTTTHLLWRGPAADYERWRICRPVDDGLAFFRAHYRYQWCDTFGDGLAALLLR
jgi:hypothetical protein